MTYTEIAKALIRGANNKSKMGNCFDFSDMGKLANQLEEIFIIKKNKTSRVTLKNVAQYLKEL